MPTVDAHHHFWRPADMPAAWHTPERAVLHRDHGPDDLAPLLHASGVDATVAVQAAATVDENTRLVDLARRVDYVAGVVGWLPLDDPPAAHAELERLAAYEEVRGYRFLVERDDADWLVSPDTLDVFRALAARNQTWDIVAVTPRQVSHVLAVAEEVPDLRVVVDHLARPPVDTGGWQPWADHVRALAEHPGVALKVSVGIDILTSWDRWDASVLDRYVGWAAECFGADRLLLASNWPVVELRRPYADAWADQQAALRRAGLDESAMAAAKGGAAATWYALPGLGR